MHYYRRNIGDYYKKAGRLSILQHGIYTLLMDACYDRECFPSMEEAIDWTWANTPEEIQAVEFILKKFFSLDNGVYVQKKIKEELNNYANQKTKNSANGKRGGRPKKAVKELDYKTKETQPLLEKTQPLLEKTEPVLEETQSLNLKSEKKPKPITNNHKPRTNKYTDDDYSFAQMMLRDIVTQQPDFKPPNLESWANTIRLMRECDNRNHTDMKRVWRFARGDPFWQPRVLAANKFRKHFDQLNAQSKIPEAQTLAQNRRQEVTRAVLDIGNTDW